MAQKQDPPKRRNTLEKIDKVIKRTVKPKAASRIIKKALAQGDQSSASSSFTARAARKIATGAGKALKSMAANKIVSKMDSLPKQTYFSKNSKGIVSGKSGGDYFIEKMGKKPKPTAKIDSLLSGKKKVAPSIKIDSIKKVNPIGGSKPSVIIKKQTTVKPAKPIAKTLPYTPEKKAIIKKIMK